MSNGLKLTGIFATLVLIITIPLYTILEPFRQKQIAVAWQHNAVAESTDIYAENCAICHGAAGEGIADIPPLNNDGLRSMDETDLYDVIAGGRDGTVMGAWLTDQGGILTYAQVNDMMTFIQYTNWAVVEVRVAELGMTPPQLTQMEVTDEMLAAVNGLAGGGELSEALLLYAEGCSACHGGDGSGSPLAPALDSADLRGRGPEEITRTITYGVSGTLMAGWENALTPVQIASVTTLIMRWPELSGAGVEFPEVELQSIPSTPEMIAAGDQLFHIACKSCHGSSAYGSPMAPPLNNQTFLTQTPDAAIYQIIAGGVPGTLMPAWGGRLGDEDIQTLVAYLRSLEPSAPPVAAP